MKKVKKLFLSAGAMRCGTTWLYNMLRDHPSLYFTPQKELHFLFDFYEKRRVFQSLELPLWDREFIVKPSEGGSPDERMANLKYLFEWALLQLNHNFSYDYYHSLFSLRGNEEYCCDMSNLTSVISEDNLRDLKSQFEDVKVIYLIRDPLNRLWSDFIYNLPIFNKGLQEDEWTTALILKWWNEGSNLTRWESDYSGSIEKLLNVFGDNFKVIFYEDLISNRHSVMRSLEDFLEIPSFMYVQEKIEKRVNSSSFSHPVWECFEQALWPIAAEEVRKVSQYITPHRKWRNYENYIEIHG